MAPYWKHRSTASASTLSLSPPLSPTKPRADEEQESSSVALQSKSPHQGLSHFEESKYPEDQPFGATSFLGPSDHNSNNNKPFTDQFRQQQEEQDYHLARKLMDGATNSLLPQSQIDNVNKSRTTATTVTGKALNFAHAIREAMEHQNIVNTDQASAMVTPVDATVIHATTERLLNLQKQIMVKNDHIFNATFQLEPHYNSDDDDDDEQQQVQPRHEIYTFSDRTGASSGNDTEDNNDDDDPATTEDTASTQSEPAANHGNLENHTNSRRSDQMFAAARAEASELIDICFAACDAAGRILKLPSPASFGRGIYTSNTPFSPIFFSPQHQESNMRLLLMARLKGKTEHIHSIQQHDSNTHNSIRGQTDSATLVTLGTFDEICILRKSSQCIPLLFIRQDNRESGRPSLDYDDDDAVGNDIIHRHVCQLQRLVDELLHDPDRHSPTIPQRVLPSEVKGVNGQQSAVSSFQVANRSLPPTMKLWSLRTVAYYTAPETISERAFCFPTAGKLEQFLASNGGPNGTSNQSSNKKCAICTSKGGDIKVLPQCRHAFHIQCLVRRWSKGKCFQCPTCNVPIHYRQTAILDEVQKDPAMIMNFHIGDDSSSDDDHNDNAHRHCQSLTSVVSVIVPILSDSASPKSSENALTVKYDCGSSFHLRLAAPPTRRSTSVAEQWSAQFHDPNFLPKIHSRVKGHIAKCTVCQRRQEGRLRSNLLRYIVPRSPTNHDSSGNDTNGRVFIGTMPSGTMRVDEVPDLLCSGHSPGIFTIKYQFDEGVQKMYHANPGDRFEATYLEAFLPNSAAGKQLLERLILAFTSGLAFTIETPKRGSRGVIQWSTIPHKTSLAPGPSGYPDAKYFDAAHAELDLLGVPRVSDST